MPYAANDKQPHYNTHEHPLFQALRQMAAYGQQPTPEELRAIPGYTANATRINEAIKKIRDLHNNGQHGAAETEARAALGTIGPRIEHLPMPQDNRPAPESSDDIAARMFNRFN